VGVGELEAGAGAALRERARTPMRACTGVCTHWCVTRICVHVCATQSQVPKWPKLREVSEDFIEHTAHTQLYDQVCLLCSACACACV
jgi:hypothetical protein